VCYSASDPTLLTDPALGRHDFLEVNGQRIHYVENGPRDAPLMLCLHGFPEVRAGFALLL
jgi:hypothetical protein